MLINWIVLAFTLFAALSIAWYALGIRVQAFGSDRVHDPVTTLLVGVTRGRTPLWFWGGLILLSAPLAASVLLRVAGTLPSLVAGLGVLGVAVGVKLLRGRADNTRGARGEEQGRLGNTLRAYAGSGEYGKIIDRLREELPDWPVRAVLIQATTELSALHNGAASARRAGVSPSLTDGIVGEAQRAFAAIWPSVDRIAAVAEQDIQTPALQARLDRETAKLGQLAEATRVAREGLAEATLSGGGVGDLEAAEMGLRMLGEAARELN